MTGQVISLAFALLGAAAVYGTDVFFCVVGRTALARISDAALVETMGRLHEVADRRMPVFGVIGIVGALASIVAMAIASNGLRARISAHADMVTSMRALGQCARREARRVRLLIELKARHRLSCAHPNRHATKRSRAPFAGPSA